MYRSLENLIGQLSLLPGIGRRSALRIALKLLRSDLRQIEELSEAILEFREKMRFCSNCGGLAEEEELCSICQDRQRDASLLCVVEEAGDIFAIERTGEFSGYYHVLMGALSPLDGIGPEELRIDELLKKLEREKEKISELFLATNPTLEGDATASYLQEHMQHSHLRITRISHGIPTGSSIEFAEQGALARSIRGRTEL